MSAVHIQAVTVRRDDIEPKRLDCGTAGSIGMEAIRFQFSDDWTGLIRKAVFYPIRGKPVEMVMHGTDEVSIPTEVTAYSGLSSYIVVGFVIGEDGKYVQRLVTDPAECFVRAAPKPEGGNTVLPTGTTYEQFQAQIEAEVGESLRGAEEAAAEAHGHAQAAQTAQAAAEAAEDEAIEAVMASASSAFHAAASAERAEVYKQNAELSQNAAAWFAESAKQDAEAAENAKNGMIYVSFDIDEEGHVIVKNAHVLGTTDFRLTSEGHMEVML